MPPQRQGEGNKHISLPYSCPQSATVSTALRCLPAPLLWFPVQPSAPKDKEHTWSHEPHFSLRLQMPCPLLSGSIRGHRGGVAPGDNAEKTVQIGIQDWVKSTSTVRKSQRKEKWDFLTVPVPTSLQNWRGRIRHVKGEETWNDNIRLFCRRYHLLSIYYMSNCAKQLIDIISFSPYSFSFLLSLWGIEIALSLFQRGMLRSTMNP